MTAPADREDGEWDPQPAKLREGEHPDVDLDSHARRNLEQIRLLEREQAAEERRGEEGDG